VYTSNVCGLLPVAFSSSIHSSAAFCCAGSDSFEMFFFALADRMISPFRDSIEDIKTFSRIALEKWEICIWSSRKFKSVLSETRSHFLSWLALAAQVGRLKEMRNVAVIFALQQDLSAFVCRFDIWAHDA
jgi:hypothetical protein